MASMQYSGFTHNGFLAVLGLSPTGVGNGVQVGLGVAVGVMVGVSVAINVSVTVAVGVTVAVDVSVTVAVGVLVSVGEAASASWARGTHWTVLLAYLKSQPNAYGAVVNMNKGTSRIAANKIYH
jgi:hypothetical protein